MVVQSINSTEVMNHVQLLASLPDAHTPSRFTGYAGFYMAADYINQTLAGYGYTPQFESFDVTVPVDDGATIAILDRNGNYSRVLRLYPFLPNTVNPCTTPPDGIEGRLVYAGYSDLAEYSGQSIAGSIILLDYNSRWYWRNAAMLGAKAVIFTEPLDTTWVQSEQKLLRVPANFPRLYALAPEGRYLRELCGQPDAVTVRVVSRMHWENRQVANIIASRRGSLRPLERVVIAAPYDSYSFVPSVNPGATSAINTAVLLEAARFFAGQTPARTLSFAFLAGHGQGLWGAREFVDRHFDEIATKIKLFIALDLSYDSSDLGVFGRDSVYTYRTTMEAARLSWVSDSIFSSYRNLIVSQIGKNYTISNGIFVSEPLNEPNPNLFQTDSAPFTLAGGAGVALHTTNALRTRQSTPMDTYDYVDETRVAPQIELSMSIIYAFSNEATIAVGSSAPSHASPDWGFAYLRGRIGLYNLTTAWYDPFHNPDSIVHVQWSLAPMQTTAGFSAVPLGTFDVYVKPDANGDFVFKGVKPYTILRAEGYVVNSTTGKLQYATDFGVYGLGKGFQTAAGGSTIWMPGEDFFLWLPLFETSSMVLFNVVDPTTSSKVGISVQNLYTLSHGWNLRHSEDIYEDTIVAFVPPSLPVELVLTAAEKQAQAGGVSSGAGLGQTIQVPLAVLTNSSTFYPDGRGYALAPGEQLILTPLDIANQLYLIDESRIQTTRAYHTYSAQIEQFHPLATSALRLANAAWANTEYDVAFAYAISAWSYERSAYAATMSLLYDVMNSVVFFFLLTVPAAFLLQRLIMPRKRTALEVAVVFLALFLPLWLLHPGFHIAVNVYMVIIGAGVAILTIFAVSRVGAAGFGALEIYRERVLGVHYIKSIARAAFLVSYSVGVENLRKRKARTSLILTTLLIIGASLAALTSASFITVLRTTEREAPTSYDGFLIRDPLYNPQAELMYKALQYLYKGQAEVTTRTWVVQQRGFRVDGMASVTGAFGLSASETEFLHIEDTVVEGRWFDRSERLVCLIPQPLARQLGKDCGDSVSWLGLSLSIVGVFDENRFADLKDLDQEPFTPVMYVANRPVHLTPSQFIIVPYELLIERFSSFPFTIAAKFANATKLAEAAPNLSLQTMSLNIYVGNKGRIALYSARAGYGVSQTDVLLIPLVLSSLTVLNVMIASVYERTKEIAIYSAVGVAPSHISYMFLAESTLYAFISISLGYLVAVVGMGALGLLQISLGLQTNYASTFIVVVAALLMTVVTVSTIYPASKASRLAVPSLVRKWRMPTRPVGDEWSIPLPFRTTPEEARGLLTYLKEYVDASSGVYEKFTSSDSSYLEGVGTKELVCEVRLAPFDLGLRQQVSIRAFHPSPDDSSMTFEVHIHRISGHAESWITSNYLFVDDIRKQFLVWRGLPLKQKERYIERRNA